MSDYSPSTKPFADLLNDPANMQMVVEHLRHTIVASFAIDARELGRPPQITTAKVKERWQICERWFRIMRGELGFGLVRTLDTIPRALAHELLGLPFDPKIGAEGGWGVQTIPEIVGKLR
jgi:hypothetical protein